MATEPTPAAIAARQPSDGTAHAYIVATLPSSITLSEREDFIEKARELGSCMAASRLDQFVLMWEAPNLWSLAAVYVEAKSELDLWSFPQDLLPPLEQAYIGSDNTDHSMLSVWVSDLPPTADKRLARYRSLAHAYLNIVTCPQCGLPKADGYVCLCGYDL